MRRLVAAGGLGIAACTCGLLLSGAASARQAGGDTITVTGRGKGKTIVWTANGSAFNALVFNGESNDSIVTINDPSDPAASCNVTPTNNGGGCNFPTPVTSATIQTIWSGPLPTMGSGIVVYANAHTATFTAPVTMAPPGQPSVTHTFLRGMDKGRPYLEVWVDKGEDAPEIESLSVGTPPGLTFAGHTFKPGNWSCQRDDLHKATCKGTPKSMIKATLEHPALRESKALEEKVRHHKAPKLYFTFTIKDSTLHVTILHEEIKPH